MRFPVGGESQKACLGVGGLVCGSVALQASLKEPLTLRQEGFRSSRVVSKWSSVVMSLNSLMTYSVASMLELSTVGSSLFCLLLSLQFCSSRTGQKFSRVKVSFESECWCLKCHCGGKSSDQNARSHNRKLFNIVI